MSYYNLDRRGRKPKHEHMRLPVLELRKKGWSMRQIALELKISHSMVSRFIKRGTHGLESAG